MHENPYSPVPKTPPFPPPNNPANNPIYAPPPSYNRVQPFESGHTRALLVIIFLAAGIFLDVITIASDFMQVNLLSDVLAGREVSAAAADSNDTRVMLLGIIYTLNFLLTVVFFLMWFHRAYRNLPALGADGLEHTPGWAVGGFFVPFLNLVRPFQIMREVWKASSPEVALTDGVSWQYAASSPLLAVWWGAWLVSNVLGQLVFRFSSDAKRAEDFITLSYLDIASSFVTIIAAALVILIIRTIDARQTEKHRLLTTANPRTWGPQPPPWGPPPPPPGTPLQWGPPDPPRQ